MAQLVDDLEKVGVVSREDLLADRMLRHAVERILSQLVELAVSVNGHVGAALLRKSATDYRSSFLLLSEAGALPAELAGD